MHASVPTLSAWTSSREPLHTYQYTPTHWKLTMTSQPGSWLQAASAASQDSSSDVHTDTTTLLPTRGPAEYTTGCMVLVDTCVSVTVAVKPPAMYLTWVQASVSVLALSRASRGTTQAL